MATQITRRVEFDYGHRVLKHESKCKHLHGHRGVAEVSVGADHLDALGRVIDFGVLKEVVGGWIDEHWDHNMLLHYDDPLLDLLYPDSVGQRGYPSFANDARILGLEEGGALGVKGPIDQDVLTSVFGGKEPFVMPQLRPNPTAENMAAVLYCVVQKLLHDRLSDGGVVRVRLYETPNCFSDFPT